MISNKRKRIFDWWDFGHLARNDNVHEKRSYKQAKDDADMLGGFILSFGAYNSPLLKEIYGY